MKISFLSVLLLLTSISPLLQALPDPNASAQGTTTLPALKYKVISGYKEPFNDDFRLHLSKGWTPVGGISVTSWNGDLYFAQLLSHRVDR
jgi:hypothetical protein